MKAMIRTTVLGGLLAVGCVVATSASAHGGHGGGHWAGHGGHWAHGGGHWAGHRAHWGHRGYYGHRGYWGGRGYYGGYGGYGWGGYGWGYPYAGVAVVNSYGYYGRCYVCTRRNSHGHCYRGYYRAC